jgi:hypothetical protein
VRKYGIVLALVAGLVAAWATTSTSAISSPQVFNLLSADSGTAQPINGFTWDRAPRAGDQFGFADNLYKWAGTKRGAKVGTDQGIGTFLTVTESGGTQVFNAQANLSGGSILVSGVITYTNTSESTFKLAVIGGTGKYDNVRGYIIVKQLPVGDNSNLEFHLLP